MLPTKFESFNKKFQKFGKITDMSLLKVSLLKSSKSWYIDERLEVGRFSFKTFSLLKASF